MNAPAELRESLAAMPDKALLDRCGGFRPGPVQDTTASTKHALRALAKRWVDLDTEITGHDRLLDTLTAHAAPTLRDGYDTTASAPTRQLAEMLIVFGDNPHRIRSEAAFAKLCGACPIPHRQG